MFEPRRGTSKLAIEDYNMKNFSMYVIMVVAVFMIFNNVNAQSLTGDSWAEIESEGSGTITVTYFEEDAFAYTNEAGELTGVSIDILNHFFNYIRNTKSVDINVEYVRENDFGLLYRSVRDGPGGVFGAANVTITERRAEEIGFSPSYITNIAILISHENAPDLSDMSQISSEFAGKTGILYTGTTHEQRIIDIRDNYFPDMNTVTATSDNEVISMVSQSENYFGYVDLYNYWLALQSDIPIKRQEVGDQASENFGFIYPIDSDWGPLLNDFFNLGSGGYRANPAYRNILVNHLGTEVTRLLEMARRNNN